jgi:hypothetical protein
MDSQVLMNVAPGERGEFVIGEVRLTLGGFLREGFAHVIPDGWDHCLFMLAMFLGAASLAQALTRSLIFTLGHSVTLGLVAFGALPPAGDWIEPIIAATIGLGGAYVYFGRGEGRQMLLVPLAFGLIHGLGFAAAVTDKLAEWRQAQVVQVLVGFNLGVELAQVTVILLAAGLLAFATRANLPMAGWRRGLGGAIALAGFGVMLWRAYGLLTGEG